MLRLLFSKLMKKIQISSIRSSEIDKKAKIASQSNIVSLKIGKYSYVGNGCTISNVEIGKFCSVADNCIIGGASHPIEWISTSPVFHEGNNILGKNFSKHSFQTTKRTYIGNDVWIGNNCLIKSGVTVGNGSIVGMGSVVTKDIPSFEIWAGNPARKIRDRFQNEIKEDLNVIEWWNYPEELLAKNAKNSNNVKKFLKNIDGGNE